MVTDMDAGRADRSIVLLGVASGYGAGNPACQDGPAVLRAMGFLDDLAAARDGFRWDEPIRLEGEQTPAPNPLYAVARIAARLADRSRRMSVQETFRWSSVATIPVPSALGRG